MITHARLVAAVESHHCPNSTDGGLAASDHRIGADGYCFMCDRGLVFLGRLHGIEA